ncbi:MAG: hypothetical protein ABI954_06390 [Pyrinomonadaceae bacterium]
MYCPICGQQQVSDMTRFCSRCGFLLTGIAQVVANNGNVPFIQPESSIQLSSPRKKGIKFGGALMLSGVILTPIAAILADGLRIENYVVPLIAILTFLGGLLSMVFSALFLSGLTRYSPPSEATSLNNLQNANHFFQSSHNKSALPPQSANFDPVHSTYVPPAQQSNPVRGSWRDPNTNELMMQPSVTEDTTKLLEQQDPK